MFRPSAISFSIIFVIMVMGPALFVGKSFHSFFLLGLQSKLYLHGGVRNGQVTDELWEFDTATGNWTMLLESGYPVSGHTAHVVNRTMLVFFGYSPVFGYLNHVQQYDFGGFWHGNPSAGHWLKGSCFFLMILYGYFQFLTPMGPKCLDIL